MNLLMEFLPIPYVSIECVCAVRKLSGPHHGSVRLHHKTPQFCHELSVAYLYICVFPSCLPSLFDLTFSLKTNLHLHKTIRLLQPLGM